MDLDNNQSLTIAGGAGSGTIDAGGLFTLNSGGHHDLILAGTIASRSTGGGVLSMSNNGNNRIYANTAGVTLTNDVNHTIEGSGQIGINNGGNGFTLINNGTILANQSVALSIAPSGNTTNNGTST